MADAAAYVVSSSKGIGFPLGLFFFSSLICAEFLSKR